MSTLFSSSFRLQGSSILKEVFKDFLATDLTWQRAEQIWDRDMQHSFLSVNTKGDIYSQIGDEVSALFVKNGQSYANQHIDKMTAQIVTKNIIRKFFNIK